MNWKEIRPDSKPAPSPDIEALEAVARAMEEVNPTESEQSEGKETSDRPTDPENTEGNPDAQDVDQAA